jgi:hypothetical protein
MPRVYATVSMGRIVSSCIRTKLKKRLGRSHTDVPPLSEDDSQEEDEEEDDGADPPVCCIGCQTIEVRLVLLSWKSSAGSLQGQDELIFAGQSMVNGVDLPAQASRSALSRP